MTTTTTSSFPDYLPNCLCGEHRFKQGSMHMGMGSTFWFTCAACGRFGVDLCRGFSAVLLPSETGGTVEETSQQMCDYINDVLHPFWLAMRERPLPDGTSFDAACLEYRHIPASTPPALPDGLEMFIQDRNGGRDQWRRVTHAESREQVMPPDPRRVNNDAFWQKIADFMALPPLKIVPNEYSPDMSEVRPWFSFESFGGVVTMGWRSHVAQISVHHDGGFDAASLVYLAKRDQVTASHDTPRDTPRDTPVHTKDFYIHAYSRGSIVSYLDEIMDVLRRAARFRS